MAAPALRLELNLLDRALDKFDVFPEDLALAQPPDLRGLRGSQRTGQKAMDKGAQGRRSCNADPSGTLCPSDTVSRLLTQDARNIPPGSIRRLIWWRRNVAWRIGRRRSCIGRGLGCRTRGGADNGTNRDARRDATPVRSGVIIAVAAAAIHVYIPVGVYIRVASVRHVRIAAIRHVCIAAVRHVPMEVVGAEISAAVRGTGGTLPATACRTLPATAGSALTSTTTATSAILHENQFRLLGLDSCVRWGRCLYRSRNTVRCEWRKRRCYGATRERQGGREQQCGFRAHFSAPDIWLEAP